MQHIKRKTLGMLFVSVGFLVFHASFANSALGQTKSTAEKANAEKTNAEKPAAGKQVALKATVAENTEMGYWLYLPKEYKDSKVL